MCRLVGSTEPLRQSILPLTDSSSLVKLTAHSQLQAFPAHLLLTTAFQSTLQTFLLQRTHYRHLSITVWLICACTSPKYTLTFSREVMAVKV